MKRKTDKSLEYEQLNTDTLKEIDRVLQIMARLRAPEGCPWDAAQTHESLLQNLLEETYEFIHAVQKGDKAAMIEELGDLLLQVIFHAQLASERNEFDMGDIARELSDKLIRRHPHVFDGLNAENEEEALECWQQAKHKEGKQTVSLATVPASMPALLRARKVVDKAGKVGFEWRSVDDALKKLDEEIGEFRCAIRENITDHIYDELGDVLFMTACVARYVKQCPELALQATIEKFITRFTYIERRLEEEGLTPEDVTLEKMDGYWDEAKELEKKN